MKRIVSSLLVIVILFNFILCSDVYATNQAFQGTDSITENSISAKDQEMLINEGKTEDKSGMMGDQSFVWTLLGGIFGTIAGILAAVANLFPVLVQACMTIVSGCDGLFTIEQAVFNEIGVFNINYFNFNNSYTIGSGDNEKTITIDSSITSKVKESVAKFFVILRLIALALSLLILIYVGIRMALSTVSSDKAKYKQMLIAWVESIVMLFMMQYIISIIINLGEMFGNVVYNIKCSLDSNGEMGFEADIMDAIIAGPLGNAGWNFVANVIPYWFLVFIQTKFFLSYFRRLITVGFLILISPLITITYPIDKIGDGKAQAYSVWFNELAINVFIQPIHAIIYLVFMYTAGEIAKHSMIVALVFLLALTKVEKIVLFLFNLRNVTSLKPVDEERRNEK